MSAIQQLLAAGGAPTDPNFSNVRLLLHGDGTNGAQNNTFVDSSPNNFTITRNGNTTQGSFSPFPLNGAAYNSAVNGGSGYFDGAGDYLQSPVNTALNFGTGDFTVEFWMNANSFPAAVWRLFCTDTGGWTANTLVIGLGHTGAGRLFLTVGSAMVGVGGSTTLSTGTWYHIALTRSGTSVKLFLNGVQEISGTSSADLNFGQAFIGGFFSGAEFFNGYISNLRVIKGTALYTANFTPPTAPLTAVTNTSLLLNFTNAGIYDNAAKVNLETVGNAQISTTQKKFGTGSMYFDGSGDYLQSPVSNDLKFGTGDFTVEFWFNSSSLSGVQRLFGTDTGAWGANTLSIGYGYPVASKLYLTVGSGVYGVGGSTTLSTNTWYYVAVTRSGTAVKLFLNGVQEISGTSSADLNFGQAFVGGFYSGGEFFNGYIDDIRITKGVARYTANFIPPTAPFPDQ